MAGETNTGVLKSRFFFLHFGTLVALFAYFLVFEGSSRSEWGLRTALLLALLIHSAYLVVARRLGEVKQADIGFWLFYAAGLAGLLTGSAWWIYIYQMHSAAAVFGVFALSALLPPLVGRDPFTFHYMRRSLPPWQMRMAVTRRIGRLVWLWWVGVFFACVAMTLWQPWDPRWTALYPNLLIFLVGLPANHWLPALYLKLFPPGAPDAAETAIMGLPFAFDAAAAAGARADIQFLVSGPAAGEYWVRIADGACQTYEGRAPTPTLTVHTPDAVWLGIARGEIDGAEALAAGRYQISGDGAVLGQLPVWFPRREGATA